MLAVLSLALLAVPAVPAAADHAAPPGPVVAGSGNLEGTEVVQDEDWLGQPCFLVRRSVFGLRGAGSYHGRTASGDEVVYQAQVNQGQTLHANGPLQVEVENTQTYYHGPFGTHGTTGGCASTGGDPVPAEFKIFAAEGTQDIDGDSDVDVLTGAAWVYRLDEAGAKVPCTGRGTFARWHFEDNPNWRAEWTLGSDCTVVGNQAGASGTGVAPATTAQTHHGVHAACFSYPCQDNIKVDYAQYLPIDGPFLALSGPTSSPTGETVTVTARLTDDGNPVPNAPVTFSAAGPAPAAPPGGAGVTGADGRASFTFTAADPGDYTVTASASHAGQALSARHTVRFVDPEPLSVTLAGPTRWQTEEAITVTATVAAAGDPVPAVSVDFAVAGAGQATPAAGSAITGADGRASFTFTGDEAGDYTVTASATHLGQEASATHGVHLETRTFYREAALTLPSDEPNLRSAVIDPAGDYAYFGTSTSPGRVVKVDLNGFKREAAITLNSGENYLTSAVMDPGGRFAYFGTRGPSIPPRVIKIDLDTFQRVGAITLDNVVGNLSSAVIDPAGDYAYFATDADPSQVVKVDLSTFQQAGVITFEPGERSVRSAVMGPAGDHAYFGARGEGQSPGRLVKVDLASFQRVGAVTFEGSEENWPRSAVIDPTGGYAYVAVYLTATVPNRVVKVDLNAFQRVGAITLQEGENNLDSAVIDRGGDFAYFGTGHGVQPARVVKVDLDRFERAHAITLASDETDLQAAVIDPDGSHSYFGTNTSGGSVITPYPPKVIKVALTRPPPVTGGAFGYYSKVSLFGGPAEERGPAPTVRLPSGGSAEPITATAPSGEAVYGPATIFSSGQLDVSTQGTTGPGGSVASSTKVVNVNRSGDEVFTAAEVASTCNASEAGLSGTTTITGGTLRTSEGDPNVEGDDTVVAIPTNPAPNTSYEGQLETVGDRFRYVFNEQVKNPDGSITVYAAHQYLLGPTAVGDLFIGKAECGVTGAPSGQSPPVAADDAYSTKRDTALNVPAPGVLGNDTDADGDPLSAGSASDPAGGSVVLNADGSFTYTPDAGFTGTDTFTYVVSDGPGGTDTATVTITVEAPAANLGVVADFDGDGDTDRSVFRAGAWYAEGQPTAYFGLGGDIAVPGDYDGDGDADRAVYRPSTGAWYVAGAPTVYHGAPGDVPVPGDYDGDGDTDIAVFRPSSGAWHVAGQPTQWLGLKGDIPVPGDYDGNGTTDRGVFRPSSGAWYVTGQPTQWLGRSGDVPVPGAYNADASTDRAVWRPGSGGWFLAGQPTFYLGAKGDSPLPLPAAIYRAFFTEAGDPRP